MRGLAITNYGIEDTASEEIKEISGAETSKGKGFVSFQTDKFENFFRLCYRCQSISKLILVLSDFKISRIHDIKEQIEQTDLKEWITGETSFVVRSIVLENEISRQELEPETGGFIIENTGANVDLENPDTTFFVFVQGDHCFFGIDFSGEDLSKRDYRIFQGSDTINATTSYALLRRSGFNKKESLLDPFCRSGTIVIEAALFSADFPVNYFSKDKFLFMKLKKFIDFDFIKFFEREDRKISKKKNIMITAASPSFQQINAAKKNANIAGILKQINFSRKESRNLDLRFDEKSIDLIITFPPQKSRIVSENKIRDIYRELFHQAGIILKDKGSITLLLRETDLAESIAESYGFHAGQKEKVMQGKEEFYISVFSRKG